MLETSIRMREMRNWTLCRGLLPPKRKKNLLAAFRARITGNVGAPVTVSNFAPPLAEKKEEKHWLMVVHLDLLAPYQGSVRDERP
jgi:hypothetical protein